MSTSFSLAPTAISPDVMRRSSSRCASMASEFSRSSSIAAAAGARLFKSECAGIGADARNRTAVQA